MTETVFWTLISSSILLCRKAFHICLSALTAELKGDGGGGNNAPSPQTKHHTLSFPFPNPYPSPTRMDNLQILNLKKNKYLSPKKRTPSCLISCMSQMLLPRPTVTGGAKEAKEGMN